MNKTFRNNVYKYYLKSGIQSFFLHEFKQKLTREYKVSFYITKTLKGGEYEK